MALLLENGTHAMGAESTTRKDSLRVEKVSVLALMLCVVVLVCLLVFRPF
jgi:ABC-type Fe3+ transport system permease subunit